MIIPPMTLPQLRAATSEDRLCYVKAGPGSGKTFTAAEAFGYLRLIRYHSDGRGICGTTFARSARRELANRIRLRWGPRATDWPNAICTFDELHRRLVRSLAHEGLVHWPGGRVPDRPEDSWAFHPAASSRPGRRSRFKAGLDDDGHVCVVETTNPNEAPAPAFTEPSLLAEALETGVCTHSDIRNVLCDAVDERRHPLLNDAIRACLRGSFCHLVVDEAFDMNPLDIAVVRRAIEAGLSITIIGDPWQSLYEFRGSAPKLVVELLEQNPFRQIDMPGEHRYKTDEMIELAAALFYNLPFHVEPADQGDEFDVVLAHDWGTLWAERRIITVPAGKWNQIDRGMMSSCFVLLLNEYVQQSFGIDAAGVGEARRALPDTDVSELLAPAMDALVDPEQSTDDVWTALRTSFQPNRRTWPEPGLIAQRCMTRLVDAARADGPPLLGLSVHQAKGLEWDRVLFLDPMLTTNRNELNVLKVDELSHRNIYVALTRARSLLRVAHVALNPYGSAHSPVTHVRRT